MPNGKSGIPAFAANDPVMQDSAVLITESWARSQAYGVDRRAETLPPIRNRSVLTNLITQLNQRDSYFYEAEADLLASIGAAIIFTNEHLDVFAIRGSRELKDKLRAINLRFGANLAESNIGTNALALSFLSGKEVWVAGNEHYMSVLSGYVCVASCAERSPDNRDAFFPNMIIIPMERFQNHHRVLFSYILKTHLYRQNSLLNSNYLIYAATINALIGRRRIYYLSLDVNNRVVDMSDQLLDQFNLKAHQTIGCDLSAIFPGLGGMVEQADKLAPGAIFEYTTLHKLLLYVKVYPVSSYGQPLGKILILSPTADFMDAPAAIPSANGEGHVASTNILPDRDKAHYRFEDILGENKTFSAVRRQAQAVAQRDSSVLITGASGTGKDMFAQAIHTASGRCSVFITFSCASVPKEFVELELFGFADGLGPGNRKGGAPGKIELANGGTLYLDEIGDMSLEQQVHLLRVLETRSVIRLGDAEARPVDIRVIASTSRDLARMVQEGQFRADLYYRLNVFQLDLPLLSEHISDIPLLANHFCREFAAAFGKETPSLSQEATALCLQYAWPGNVRELRNSMESAMNLVQEGPILPEHLPKAISGFSRTSGPSFARIDSERQYQEYALITQLLERFHGNKSKVAEALGISRPALYRRLKAYGLEDS
ncbi:MAG: sigma 54-interacting transcriptional regulator [Oscillospiraceae bacterium]|nr:sigma 54-interacting transcriptional regulator [Oscillospiraceae bacterium]